MTMAERSIGAKTKTGKRCVPGQHKAKETSDWSELLLRPVSCSRDLEKQK